MFDIQIYLKDRFSVYGFRVKQVHRKPCGVEPLHIESIGECLKKTVLIIVLQSNTCRPQHPRGCVCVCRCVCVCKGGVVVVASVLVQNAGEVLSQSFRVTLINTSFK